MGHTDLRLKAIHLPRYWKGWQAERLIVYKWEFVDAITEAPLSGELARLKAETEGWLELCSSHLKRYSCCSDIPTTPQSASLTAPLIGEPDRLDKLPFISRLPVTQMNTEPDEPSP